MRNTYIIHEGQVDPLTKKKICIFAHYSSDKTIRDSDLYWVKSLFKWDCAVFFVSSVEQLKQKELEKISPYVAKVIVRPDHGYDFGSYCIGFDLAQEYTHAEYLVIMNDSCFGPVNSLNYLDSLLPKTDYELLANSDFRIGTDYILQSFFYVWRYSQKSIENLKSFFQNWDLSWNKFQVGEKGEWGMTVFFKAKGYHFNILCPLTKLEEKAGFFGNDAYLPFWHLSLTHFYTPFLKKIIFKKYYENNNNPFANIYYPILERHNAFFEEKHLSIIAALNPDLVPIIKKEIYHHEEIS